MRWEDDGLWATDPAAEEVSRMLDAICHRCDRALHQCTCAEAAARILCPMCGSFWEDGCRCNADHRAEDIEAGIAMRHARPDDEWESD